MYFDEHPECKEYNKSFPVVKDKKPVVCHPRLTPVHRHTDTSFIPDEIIKLRAKGFRKQPNKAKSENANRVLANMGIRV